jgi:hypothetical protein
VQAGVFESTVGPVENGRSYGLYFFVDADRDGRCDAEADAGAATEPGGVATEYSIDLLRAEVDYAIELPAETAPDGFCRSFTP